MVSDMPGSNDRATHESRARYMLSGGDCLFAHSDNRTEDAE